MGSFQVFILNACVQNGWVHVMFVAFLMHSCVPLCSAYIAHEGSPLMYDKWDDLNVF